MARNKENEFPAAVKRDLEGRVNGRCSRPDCRKYTRGPRVEGGTVSLGDAAHITAASEGGARYDSTLTPEQRRAIDNGIWLCKDHAWEVDHDAVRYPVEILYEWKRQAEADAHADFGRRSLTQADVTETVHQLVTSNGTRFIPSLLSTAVASVVKQMQQLDPRFDVKPEYRDGIEVFNFYPLEEVTLKFSVPSEENINFKNHIQSLLAHGKPFEIDISNWGIRGSPLLEKIIEERGRRSLRVEPALKHSSELQICCNSPIFHDAQFSAISLRGETAIGVESVSFAGIGLEDLLQVDLRFPLHLEQGAVANLDIHLNLDAWSGQKITVLPHLPKLLALAEALRNNEALTINFEINGYSIIKSIRTSLRSEGWNEIVYLLRFIDYLQEICRYTRSQTVFDKNIVFIDDDFEHIKQIALAIRNKGRLEAPIEEANADCTMEMTTELSSFIGTSSWDGIISFESQIDCLELGGQSLPLPKIKRTFFGAKLISPTDQRSVVIGEPTKLIWKIRNGKQEIALI